MTHLLKLSIIFSFYALILSCKVNYAMPMNVCIIIICVYLFIY